VIDPARYLTIATHYERCLSLHGDSHLGVDWPDAEDVAVRHAVMLGVIRSDPKIEPVELLDFGCGASHLQEFIQDESLGGIVYSGADISSRFVELSAAKFPNNRYWCVDVLADGESGLPRFDYAVLNGVFTVKGELSFDEMLEFCKGVVTKVFAHADVGIAFNMMSVHVDWQRDDLFHVPFDLMAEWLRAEVSPHYVFRSDYGLYEWTAYVYR
jgi:hypothetical protein